jgi:hypothetical protein
MESMRRLLTKQEESFDNQKSSFLAQDQCQQDKRLWKVTDDVITSSHTRLHLALFSVAPFFG